MPPCPAITHVIYDMDGVLLDTEPFYTEASRIVCARYGRAFDYALKSHMVGRTAIDAGSFVVEALALPLTPEQFLVQREAILDTLFPTAEAMPGAQALTAHLQSSGVPQGVASSSRRRLYELKTTKHRPWFERFHCVVLSDDPDVHAGKPAPDLFLVAAKRLGADPERCLVIEDAPAGIAAARAAGMPVVAVPDRHMPRELFVEADLVLESLEALDLAAWGLPPR